MPVSQVANPPLTQLERITDTFVAPTETFRDIMRSAAWWLAYLILALSALCVTLSIQQRVGWEQIVQNQLQQSPAQQNQLNSLDPAARALRIHAMAIGYQVTSYASPLILLLVSILAALVLWGSFTFGLGSRATFPQFLCLWMYCSLPRVLTGVITVVTLWFGESPDTFDLRQPAGTSLGYYLTGAPYWLHTLLGFFDVISLWSIVLLIFGGSIVARVKRSHASVIVLGWWLLLMLLSVGITAAFS